MLSYTEKVPVLREEYASPDYYELIPIAVFMLAVLGSVALAYFLGWRKVRKINLAEVLRDDTMM